MAQRILAIGSKSVNRRVADSLYNSGIELVCNSDIDQSLKILKTEKFDLALIDGYIDNLETAFYRITWLSHTPVALVIQGTQRDWDLLRNLDVDGFIPEEARNIELTEHFTEITRRGQHKFDRVKILVIEDDDQIREALRLSFQIYWPQAEILFSAFGEDGVKLAKNTSVDIVLLDLVLPDISGHEVLSKIRSFSLVPVIVLTASRKPEDVFNAINSGANDFIIKPFKQLELMSRHQTAC